MNPYSHNPVVRSGRSHPVLRFLSEGPLRLLTARFSRRHAVLMVVLSAPALLATALFTVPAFLFHTPQHNEYFEFAKQLNQGGERWIAMGLSACCSIFCFAIPYESCAKTEDIKEDPEAGGE